MDGVDYHFVDVPTFRTMIDHGDFLEWAEVHGNLYGTSLSRIRHVLEGEREDLFLVIDVQGAAILRDKGVPFCGVFLLPPSLDELARRLTRRGEDAVTDIQTRLSAARNEIEEASGFDYIVVNDDLETAIFNLAAIVTAERLKTENRIIDLTLFN